MINGLRVAALCPMGAHSERVPGKNWKLLGGRPLFAYMVRTLKGCAEVDEIAVNTDAPGDVRRNLESDGVRVIERPAELRGSMVDFNRILAHDMGLVAADIYVQTHVTTPFLRASTIAAALRLFTARRDCDSLIGVRRMYKRFWTLDRLAVNHDESRLRRLQDTPPLFMDAAALYMFTRESFGRRGHRQGESPLFFDVPAAECLDIDTYDDFLLAEAVVAREGAAP